MRTNKIKSYISLLILSLCSLALLFVSCDNITEDSDEQQTNKTCTVSFGINEKSSRTIMPSEIDTAGLSFKLIGEVDPESDKEGDDDYKAAIAELAQGIQFPTEAELTKKSYKLIAGVEWKFYLLAYKNDEYQATEKDESGNDVYTFSGDYAEESKLMEGTATIVIKNGANPIIFEMEPPDNGYGSIDITFNCNLGEKSCSKISKITPVLKTINGESVEPVGSNILTLDKNLSANTYYITPDLAENTDENYTTFTFKTGALNVGKYLLTFEFELSMTGDDTSSSPVTTVSYYSEVVTIENYSVSKYISKTTKEATDITLRKFNQLYPIHYKTVEVNDEGEATVSPFTYFKENATIANSFNPASTAGVILPTASDISRNDGKGKTFFGWYEYNEETKKFGESKITIFSQKDIKEAKTFYARWTDLNVYVSENGTDDETATGDKLSPFKTLNKAISYVKDKHNANDSWIIHVSGNVKTADASNTQISNDLNVKELVIQGDDENASLSLPDNITEPVLKISDDAEMITLKNLKVTGGNSTDGGGIFISNESTNVTLDNVTITGNNATVEETANGGGVFNKGTLFIKDSTISANKAKESGGGLYNYNTGTVYIYGNTTIDNNTATGTSSTGGGIHNAGGKIYIGSDSSSVVAASVSISNNKAKSYGGGIHNSDGGNFITHTNSNYTSAPEVTEFMPEEDISQGKILSILSNKVTNGEGAGVANIGGMVLLKDSVIYGNGTTEGYTCTSGGGIFQDSLDSNNSSTALHHSILAKNIATTGGALYTGDSTAVSNLAIECTTVYDNTANENGGGILLNGTNSGSTYSIVKSDIKKNHAKNGAGLYATTSQTGIVSFTEISVMDNIASEDGGGIYNLCNDLTLTSATISGNTSNGNGGGIYNEGTMTLDKDENNKSPKISENNAVNGGGVYNAGNVNFIVTFNMNEGEIMDNTGTNGAGVYNAGSTATFNMAGGTIGGNIATQKEGNGGNGGGVYNAGTMFMYGSAVIGDSSSNTVATKSQGVIYASNRATYGGGIYNTGTLKVGYNGDSQSELSYGIYYNYASSSGGGIYNANTANDFMISSGILAFNYAGSTGAGIYNEKTFIFNGGSIIKNIAGSNGGGLYNNGTTFMYGTAVIGDKDSAKAENSENANADNCSNRANDGPGGGISNVAEKKLYLGYSSESTKVALTGGIYFNFATKGGGIDNAGILSIASGEVLKNGKSSSSEDTKAGIESTTINTDGLIQDGENKNGEIQSD